ncbi:MAG TPA: hypothetical protein VFC10_12525 [Terriglobia bacterium]|jgi:D-proline reductase (dithiol) PrdB|nr:hypothetical protein [Terriglobia bacterium]
MCHQSVGLIASVIEKAQIPTVSLSLLKMVTKRVRPPRSLCLPFGFGYPLGKPNDAKLQHQIIRAALNLLEDPGELPILKEFAPV